MHSKYTRTILVNQAIIWLVDWNYKVFLQSVGDPHLDDWANMLGSQYQKRDRANAHNALKNIISDWQHGCDGDTSEVQQMVDYYFLLSDRGFNRLFNEITRKAERRLEIKTDTYWARKMLEKRETT